MTQTIALLKIIGSPFCDDDVRGLPESVTDAKDLYTFAMKNKVGLLYLTALEERGELEKYSLRDEYIREIKKNEDQTATLYRISHLFNVHNIKYAIFKSSMPFPATPNDVDIIHFGNDDEFSKACRLMLAADYQEVTGTADTQQRMFHDTVTGGVLDPHPKKKDVFDIDLYQKVSASQLVYLDKAILERYVMNICPEGNQIKALSPEAELMAIIIHSIFPELLCTALAYYATLYYVYKMDDENILEFIDVVEANHVKKATQTHFSIVAELHQEAHGFAPGKIDQICNLLGGKENEGKSVVKNCFKLPHKYSVGCFLRVTAEKCYENEFRQSIPTQIVFSLNPKNFKWIVNNLIWRYRRETY